MVFYMRSHPTVRLLPILMLSACAAYFRGQMPHPPATLVGEIPLIVQNDAQRVCEFYMQPSGAPDSNWIVSSIVMGNDPFTFRIKPGIYDVRISTCKQAVEPPGGAGYEIWADGSRVGVRISGPTLIDFGSEAPSKAPPAGYARVHVPAYERRD